MLAAMGKLKGDDMTISSQQMARGLAWFDRLWTRVAGDALDTARQYLSHPHAA
jgi:hypothetical protein